MGADGSKHAARSDACLRVGGGTNNPRSDKRGGREADDAGGHLNIARIMRCARSAHEQLAVGQLRINLSALCLSARLLRCTALINATAHNVCTAQPGAPRALIIHNPHCTRRDGREDHVPPRPLHLLRRVHRPSKLYARKRVIDERKPYWQLPAALTKGPHRILVQVFCLIL